VRHPQLLIYRGDARLATQLQIQIDAGRWLLRKPGDLAECLEMSSRGGLNVLVLRLGRDLDDELSTVERVHYLAPDTAIIVVGDAEQAAVAGIARDLGAQFVLFPPLSRDLLPEVVAGFMNPEGVARP
jgi:hypothetical protein